VKSGFGYASALSLNTPLPLITRYFSARSTDAATGVSLTTAIPCGSSIRVYSRAAVPSASMEA
jgi:hypothetical protein